MHYSLLKENPSVTAAGGGPAGLARWWMARARPADPGERRTSATL
jgi:hypothetical protein